MYNTAIIVVQFAAILESIIIIVGNIITIFVFWKHRNRLKRTSFLLINLAVSDLLVGFTEPIALGAVNIPEHFEESRHFNSAHDKNISIAFQVTFSFASAFFLVLISVERSYALIWPLRHRVASTKGYIYSATFAWITAIFTGATTFLAVYEILDFAYWIFAFGCVMFCVWSCFVYDAFRVNRDQVMDLEIRFKILTNVSNFEKASPKAI